SMKKLLLSSLALAGMLLMADTSSAFFHLFHKKKAAPAPAPEKKECCEVVASGDACCGSVGTGYTTSGFHFANGAVAGASGVSYVPQTVTQYRTEMKTRTVQRPVSRVVTKEVAEPYTYTEVVCVTVPTKQKVTEYVPTTKQVPYT